MGKCPQGPSGSTNSRLQHRCTARPQLADFDSRRPRGRRSLPKDELAAQPTQHPRRGGAARRGPSPSRAAPRPPPGTAPPRPPPQPGPAPRGGRDGRTPPPPQPARRWGSEGEGKERRGEEGRPAAPGPARRAPPGGGGGREAPRPPPPRRARPLVAGQRPGTARARTHPPSPAAATAATWPRRRPLRKLRGCSAGPAPTEEPAAGAAGGEAGEGPGRRPLPPRPAGRPCPAEAAARGSRPAPPPPRAGRGTGAAEGLAGLAPRPALAAGGGRGLRAVAREGGRGSACGSCGRGRTRALGTLCEAPTPGAREIGTAARPEPAGLLSRNVNFQYITTKSAESRVSS